MQRTALSFSDLNLSILFIFCRHTDLNCTLLAGHPPVTLWCSIPKGIVISPNSTAFCTHSFDQYSSYMYSSMSSTLHVSIEFLFILPWTVYYGIDSTVYLQLSYQWIQLCVGGPATSIRQQQGWAYTTSGHKWQITKHTCYFNDSVPLFSDRG